MGYVVVFGQLLVLGIFLVSLVGKVRSRQAYREFITATGRLLAVGPGRARWLGLLAVAAEAAIVVLVAVPVTASVGFVLAVVTLGGFGYALVRALRREEKAAPCHCFGASETPVGRRHVIRNLVLIVAALAALGAAFTGTPGGVEIPGVVIAAAAAAMCVLVVVRLDDIAELFRPVDVRR
ncbi:MauE/DoxX family redox-associated membrane protein [Nonomuraea sp. NPDC048826]|uniref:MauE/DoxX family redox-associated membrane protein n=1 Tax=Nonomuraea sp. NPDC048826 TaxID=3364347 RepID=UPI00371C9CA6